MGFLDCLWLLEYSYCLQKSDGTIMNQCTNYCLGTSRELRIHDLVSGLLDAIMGSIIAQGSDLSRVLFALASKNKKETNSMV
jgi:hypothetical protein